MGLLPKFRPTFHRAQTDDVGPQPLSDTFDMDEKNPAVTDVPASNSSNDEGSPQTQVDVTTETKQQGVADIEAITKSWSKPTLIFVFLNMWMLYMVNAFQSTILYTLLPFVTSNFETHSFLNVIYVVGSAMSAAVYIPLSKILDVFGRAEGFALMVIFATLGLVLMAVCTNLPTFCAAYVFYSIGFSGITYCVDVITADGSRLKNRGLAYAFTSSPYMINAFAASKAANDFYNAGKWRWGFGCFAIIFPVVAAPLFFVLKWNLKKAKRKQYQSIKFYIIDFDILGVVMSSVGLTVFLLPFTIAASAPNGWASGYIIAMLVVGFIVLVGFVLYEAFWAPTPMLKFRALSNRTVIGACLLNATYQISYYCWDDYFTSFLMVVNKLTFAEANYVNNTFNVVSGVLLLISGYLIRRTGRFKWQLYFAVPFYILAQGLMIYFRQPTKVSVIEQVAILAAVDHRYVATVLALLNVVGTIGGAMGASISGAIWTNTFKKALERNLPSSALSSLEDIYEDLTTQLSYPVGSVTRLAIQKSYAFAQTRMLAAGTGVIDTALIWMLMFRNINVARFQQVHGMVF